jgi:hypothetical protein
VVEPSNFAMSAPAFAPERGEVWYSDGFSGFFAVRVTNGVWPFAAAGAPSPATTSSTSAGPSSTSVGPVAGAGALPATGAGIPRLFVVTTLLGSLLLLAALRGSRTDP